ncbi:hypothetical protein D3C80_127280 [compost metagenome]
MTDDDPMFDIITGAVFEGATSGLRFNASITARLIIRGVLTVDEVQEALLAEHGFIEACLRQGLQAGLQRHVLETLHAGIHDRISAVGLALPPLPPSLAPVETE